MSEAELLEEIARVAGAINRHKNGTSLPQSNSLPQGGVSKHSSIGRGYYGYRGSYRGRSSYRGHRGRGGFSRPTSWTRNATVPSTPPNNRSNVWTRESSKTAEVASSQSPLTTKVVDVEGISYRSSKSGQKLVRITPTDENSTETPRKATVGGIQYIRTKNGNLVMNKSKNVDIACPYFTRSGKVSAYSGMGKLTVGTCERGLSCPFRHNPDEVAICKFYLKDSCTRPNCPLSHKPSAHNTPLCVHYLKGNCTNANCKYTHMDVDTNARVCRDLAYLGYCALGDKCTKRHVFECPDFEEFGKCARKNCRLKHVLRANDTHQTGQGPVNLDALATSLYDSESDDQEEGDEDDEEEQDSQTDSDDIAEHYDNDADYDDDGNESFIRI